MQTNELKSRAKSVVEIGWGLGMCIAAGLLVYGGITTIPKPAGWAMIAFGTLGIMLGLYLLFSYSRITISPAERTWSEVSGWLFLSKTLAGKFDDLSQVCVVQQEGKNGPYYTILVQGRRPNRKLDLIYDVVHSRHEKDEIVAQLERVIGIPIVERDSWEDDE